MTSLVPFYGNTLDHGNALFASTSALPLDFFPDQALPDLKEFFTRVNKNTPDTTRKPPIGALKKNLIRRITMGTAYDNSDNPYRQAVSDLVDATHKEYAEKWSLQHSIVTGNQVKNLCQDATSNQPVDCVAYWNKIQVLRNWLSEPSKTGAEEWRIILDDDMPITNMNIDVFEAIDQLRGTTDASVIIAQDVDPNWIKWRFGWDKTLDFRAAVNTGVIFVRKDQVAARFFDKVWSHRHDATNVENPICKTLGTCRNQDALHEQEAFAKVLLEEPSLIGSAVAVVKPRTQYMSGIPEIALNTFNRAGCLKRYQKGWGEESFRFIDNSKGIWRPGDWMGQTAGVPLLGKELNINMLGMCDDDPTVPVLQIRKYRIEDMIDQTVYTSVNPEVKKKEIQIATVFDNSNNPLRQEIGKKVVANHDQYAANWKLKRDVISKSLVVDGCTNPITQELDDCSPYWNKIKYLLDRCVTPEKASTEEWAIYADDDAVYSNLNTDPFIAIDQLRSGDDTSFIIATEGQGTAVNSGVMIARKDPKGCEVIARVWNGRNHPSSTPQDVTCPTRGICMDNRDAYEQGAIDEALNKEPRLLGHSVTRIPPRDRSSPTRAHIAFNTLNRKGCFQYAAPDGNIGGAHDIFPWDLVHNANYLWQKGDWIGQTAGYPLVGRDLSHKEKCEDDPSVPVEPIRIKKINEMIKAAEH